MRPKLAKAMVLAAGYGTRLRPLTDRIPKPLVPVAGKPMIQYSLDKLEAYGIKDVIINVSHLREPLIAYLSGISGLNITLSEEAEPLETGGGLKHALPLLGESAFFVINSDIIWTDSGPTALDRLTQEWDERQMDILLMVQSKAKAVGYDRGEDHLFIHRENTRNWKEQEEPYIIAGIGVMHPRVLGDAPTGKFSVKQLWQRALQADRLVCIPHQGGWFQTGTLADLEKAEQCLSRSA
jgi:MurNAc alpha-1-phosphate uridylyltransferase